MSDKEDLSVWPATIGMVILAMLFGGVIFAIYPGWAAIGEFLVKNLKLTEHAPAWVQAVGSIGAMCVAIYVPSKINAGQLKSQREIRVNKALVFKRVTRLRITPMLEFAEFFDHCLLNGGKHKGKYYTCKEIVELINKLNFLSQEEISLIAEIDPNFAYDVSYVIHMLKAISFKLETRVLSEEEFPSVISKKYYIDLNNEIIAVVKRIKW